MIGKGKLVKKRLLVEEVQREQRKMICGASAEVIG
jgi:hypothetical protein